MATRAEVVLWLYSVAPRYAAMIAPIFAKNKWKRIDHGRIPSEQEILCKIISNISDLPEESFANSSAGIEVMVWVPLLSEPNRNYVGMLSLPEVVRDDPENPNGHWHLERSIHPYLRSDGKVPR